MLLIRSRDKRRAAMTFLDLVAAGVERLIIRQLRRAPRVVGAIATLLLWIGSDTGKPGDEPEDSRAAAEERRLFYVAMTRAKDRLFLSRAVERPWRGRTSRLDPSPFLGDIAAGTDSKQDVTTLEDMAVLADAGVLPSRSEARRLIQNGGLTINGEPVTDPAAPMPAPIAAEWWDVRIGKRRREIGRRTAG